MVMKAQFWKNRRVLVTGHTGFKGGWLSLLLSHLGATVSGYSLEPSEENQFYKQVFKKGFIGEEIFSDITNYNEVKRSLKRFKPEIIFHLAAQPLVRLSYKNPSHTFSVNAMGVVNLLEATRTSGFEPKIVNITTDKVYENKEWVWAYRESDALGGNDPYSASKACSEIITNSYVNSFFKNSEVRIATARAGNVIGGGDMSQDRLIPDYLKAYKKNEEIVVRNPLATRPWQHVIDPLSGYLQLAEMISSKDGEKFMGSWNFGPSGDPAAVGEIINSLSQITGGLTYKLDKKSNPIEAQSLMLDSAKARTYLRWRPKLGLEQALRLTFDWFKNAENETDMQQFSKAQISYYQKL